jgi:hypothetical protein
MVEGIRSAGKFWRMAGLAVEVLLSIQNVRGGGESDNE